MTPQDFAHGMRVRVVATRPPTVTAEDVGTGNGQECGRPHYEARRSADRKGQEGLNHERND